MQYLFSLLIKQGQDVNLSGLSVETHSVDSVFITTSINKPTKVSAYTIPPNKAGKKQLCKGQYTSFIFYLFSYSYFASFFLCEGNHFHVYVFTIVR